MLSLDAHAMVTDVDRRIRYRQADRSGSLALAGAGGRRNALAPKVGLAAWFANLRTAGSTVRARPAAQALALVLMVAAALAAPVGVVAKPAGGANSVTAKACQKGGYAALAPSTSPGATFASESECVSYGAQGGTVVTYTAPSLTVVYDYTRGWATYTATATGQGLLPGAPLTATDFDTAGFTETFVLGTVDSAGEVSGFYGRTTVCAITSLVFASTTAAGDPISINSTPPC